MSIIVHVPVRLVSEANSRGHWAAKAKRTKSVREAVTAAFLDAGYRVVPVRVPTTKGFRTRIRLGQLPAYSINLLGRLVVKLTRIAPRALDDDNAASACKAARDQVAELLGVDDRDPRVSWVVEQRKGKPREYGLEIRIEDRS